jgi:hypothetical protein
VRGPSGRGDWRAPGRGLAGRGDWRAPGRGLALYSPGAPVANSAASTHRRES